MDYDFLVKAEELELRYRGLQPARRLGFGRAGLPWAEWREVATARLGEVLAVDAGVVAGAVTEVRRTATEGVEVVALVMAVGEGLSVPAYLLNPGGERVVMALHGHGQVDECLRIRGVHEDYHHNFAIELAKAGHTVLLPELRGFGALSDLAAQRDGESLSYWRWGEHMVYTLLTDTFQRGRTLMGDTIEDLLRWEDWLGVECDVVGISWGGDLACAYPVFSNRVRSIFASGTLGSFEAVFAEAGNAPAHCVPGVLEWFDRADIAGLNAPRRLAVHYGALDTAGSAAPEAFAELQAIYAAAGARDEVALHVSAGLRHEMDLGLLIEFLSS
ncbi:alpha/beta fold hydrolase [Kribbella sp. NPDC056951]|uniref:alpha/beta fold hydrolase n=1 Tax=Kribbella sp. NPDC056951 TaxID=3345978 RepID=UPI00363472E1